MLKQRLRTALEASFGPISDELYREALHEAQNDIRANLKPYGVKADLAYVYYVTITYLNIAVRLN